MRCRGDLCKEVDKSRITPLLILSMYFLFHHEWLVVVTCSIVLRNPMLEYGIYTMDTLRMNYLECDYMRHAKMS